MRHVCTASGVGCTVCGGERAYGPEPAKTDGGTEAGGFSGRDEKPAAEAALLSLNDALPA
mgnify:CR=1 FL=1